MNKFVVIGIIVSICIAIIVFFVINDTTPQSNDAVQKISVSTSQDQPEIVTREVEVPILQDSPEEVEPAIIFAPDFTLKTVSGEEVTLSDYRGKKPVILDFFATWCHNCRRDMPMQQKLYEQFNEDVQVIAVNLQEKSGTVEKYMQKNNFTFSIVLDADGHVTNDYGVRLTNMHVLINKDGEVQDVIQGDILEEHFQNLLTQ